MVFEFRALLNYLRPINISELTPQERTALQPFFETYDSLEDTYFEQQKNNTSAELIGQSLEKLIETTQQAQGELELLGRTSVLNMINNTLKDAYEASNRLKEDYDVKTIFNYPVTQVPRWSLSAIPGSGLYNRQRNMIKLRLICNREAYSFCHRF